MESLKNQEGGLLHALYANALAIAKLALNDNTCSEETKEVIQALKVQTIVIYNLTKQTDVPPQDPCNCKQLVQFTPCETRSSEKTQEAVRECQSSLQ